VCQCIGERIPNLLIALQTPQQICSGDLKAICRYLRRKSIFMTAEAARLPIAAANSFLAAGLQIATGNLQQRLEGDWQIRKAFCFRGFLGACVSGSVQNIGAH